MNRVLIVSPHFPPVNAPDMQRVRLVLPHLREYGWEPVVLALAPEMVEGAVIEPLLASTYPADIRVERVRGVPPSFTRWFGVGNVWWRCGWAIRRAGDSLLREEKFDAVLLSTTQFGSFSLGPRWRRRFGVPYIVDYQDPWLNPYYTRTGTPPPGGVIKYALSQFTARCREPDVLREAAGIIAVSSSYAEMLHAQHPWFDPRRVVLLPFGATTADLLVARQHPPAEPLIDFGDGNFHHVYTGRCGPDMQQALTILFRAFRHYLKTDPSTARHLRFHFIGTDYAPPPRGRNRVLPIACAEGVAEFVHEHRERVSYFESLWYLTQAHALVAVGSDDPTYSASKIFPYILARRPMLLIYHAGSLVLRVASEMRAGLRIGFDGPGEVERLVQRVHAEWFTGPARHDAPSLHVPATQPYSAEHLTARLAAVLDAAVSPDNGRSLA